MIESNFERLFRISILVLLFVLLPFLPCFAFVKVKFKPEEKEPAKKVALLFLTRNGVNHPTFWKNILKSHADKINFYIYSDQPLADPFFETHRIKKLIPTTWDFHIKTWQLILRQAYKNPENYKFVYLSESCLPLLPLQDICEKLVVDDTSYMCFAGPWWPRDNCREVTELPIEHRWGNHEWVILNRKHAKMIVRDKQVINIVSRFWIDSESYPSTLFSVKQCLDEFCCRPTTYVNWSLPEGGGAHPYHFREDNVFNREMLFNAKKGNYFFARKFTTSFPEEAMRPIIFSTQ